MLEAVAWTVVIVAFVIFNVHAWAEGRYHRALMPWAALAGLAVGRLYVARRTGRGEQRRATTGGPGGASEATPGRSLSPEG